MPLTFTARFWPLCYNNVTWATYRFESPTILLTLQHFDSITTKNASKLYDDVIMTTMSSKITSLTIVYSTVYSGADQRKHQSSASLAYVRGIHRGPVNSPHKWPVKRKMFPFDDVIMAQHYCIFVRGTIGDRWIPVTKGQWCGKCFRVMASAWDSFGTDCAFSFMMTSSNGNIFRVTGPLCGEFTGPGEFPAQRPVTRSFIVSLICVWINGWVNNREAGDLRRYRHHYDVIVMFLWLFIAVRIGKAGCRCWRYYADTLSFLPCHCKSFKDMVPVVEIYGHPICKRIAVNWHGYIDGLVQERCNSCALAVELCLSCTNPPT